MINRNDIRTAMELVQNIRHILRQHNESFTDAEVELEIPLVLQALRCETADEILYKHIKGE